MSARSGLALELDLSDEEDCIYQATLLITPRGEVKEARGEEDIGRLHAEWARGISLSEVPERRTKTAWDTKAESASAAMQKRTQANYNARMNMQYAEEALKAIIKTKMCPYDVHSTLD